MIMHLTLSTIKKAYNHGPNPLEILRGISYTFYQKKTYCIIGASGAGKSTLLHIIGGLDKPTTGTVYCNDKEISQDFQELFLQKIGFMFQSPYLINELTILENVILKAFITQKPLQQSKEYGRALLKNIGLIDKENCFPSMLSGGEQQRVALARTLFNKPDFILADEPTSNLDEKTAKKIINLLHSYQKEWGFGLIVCSHDTYLIDTMETVLHLEDGILHDYKKNITQQNSASKRFNITQ